MSLKRFGDLKPGDVLRGSQGQPVTVVNAYDEHLPEKMWEIELEDGTLIKASGNHLWYCETILDWELLSERKRTAKRALKKVLTSKSLKLLEELAVKDEIVETALADMILLLRAASFPEILPVIVRVAEALGTIGEDTFLYEDMGGELPETSEMIRKYDARLFSQQLLKLTGKRTYRAYDLVVGSIVTTNELVELMARVNVPTVRSHGEFKNA